MSRFGTLASREIADEAARGALSEGKSALGAVLSGYFAAAGDHPGVLFSPVSLLVGGLGSGVFAYDGRCRQPGKDAKRPRGFVAEEIVPEVASVAAPASVAAAFIACAFHPDTSFAGCVRRGVESAKARGAKARATLLEIAAGRGAGFLNDPNLRKSLIAQCGSIEGGLLTASDLVVGEGLQARAERDGQDFRAPWSREETVENLGERQAIVACDARGLFACLAYVEMDRGPLFDGYEARLPLAAEPVLRGVTRRAPGTPLAFFDGLCLSEETGRGIVAAQAEVSSGQILRLDRDDNQQVVTRRTPRT